MLNAQRTTHVLLGTITLIVSIAALKYSSALLLPVLVAFFLAAMLQPLLEKLKRFLPEGLALGATLLLLGCAMVVASLVFISNVQAIAAKAPYYTKRFYHMSQGILHWAQDHGIQITWKQLGAKKSVTLLIGFLTSGLNSVFSFAGQMIVVLFVLIFMTLEVQAFQKKFKIALGKRVGSELRETFGSIAERIQQYVLAKTLISLLTGLCTWLIAMLFGLDFAVFWGLLAFLLNYIPNIGSIIAVIPPIAIAFLQFGDWKVGVGVAAGLISVQTFIGNVLEPRMLGRSMNLSPMVVFLSMLFWGWLWGIAGMILAVPLTVAIKICCEHVEDLQPVAILLGDIEGSQETALNLGFLSQLFPEFDQAQSPLPAQGAIPETGGADDAEENEPAEDPQADAPSASASAPETSTDAQPKPDPDSTSPEKEEDAS